MDVIIVGTGASALLLAQSLVERRFCDRIRLIGPSCPLRAHVLSYWSDVPTPLDAHAVAAWTTLAIVDARGVTVRARLGRFTYRTLRAQAWADAALAALLASGQVERVDAAVTGVEDGVSRAGVVARGQRLEADWVFDSRGPPVAPPDFWQHFVGWEVQVAGARFDTEVATLLDFRTPQEGDFRFTYALPLAADRLFVEHVSHRPCAHEPELERHLREVRGARHWRVLDRERGATPIFLTPPDRAGDRVVHIGVAAGLAKTSTGYALTRMWRDGEAIAESLLTCGHPHVARRVPRLSRVADRYFVDLLTRAPAELPGLLISLFAGAPAEAVMAFLDERARFGEQLAVGRAVPGWVRWASGAR